MNLVRTVCLPDGGFEPKLLPIGDTFESLISMVAAGRGVVISPEILLRNLHLPAAVNSYILEDSQSKFELFLLRRKESEPAATVNNFAKILFERRDLFVPRDLSVVGYIDIPDTERSNPPLTTVDGLVVQKGPAAARIVSRAGHRASKYLNHG